MLIHSYDFYLIKSFVLLCLNGPELCFMKFIIFSIQTTYISYFNVYLFYLHLHHASF